MFGTIYIGLAGMNAYSRGLDVISNNVANLNTTGFKAGLASFTNLVYNGGSGGATLGSGGTGHPGAGVQVDANHVSYRQGDVRETGNPLDAAIQGGGFFVLERDGIRFYTRAGQFEFDQDGTLIERITGAKVLMTGAGSVLGPLNIDAYRTFAPVATTEASLSGNLSRAGTASLEPMTLTVIDTSGAKQNLRVRFVRDGTDPLRWTVEVLTATDVPLASGALRFDANGSIAEAAPINVTVTPDNLPAFTFALSFGAVGSYGGMTSLVNNTNSQPQLLRQNGKEFGTVSGMEFDTQGNLKVVYSNSENRIAGRLVLAQFDNVEQLIPLDNGLFMTRSEDAPRLSAGLESGLGKVQGGSLELSNVELTEQFTDLIIIQRGYQASSQMTSVANEMMQQLMQMADRR
jgi:flagellar hook protein FlgE